MNDRSRRLSRAFGLLGLIGLLPAAGFAAQVYRCEHDGRTTFTDTPCAADAQPIEIAEPMTIEATQGSDLAKVYDERRAREQRAHSQADERWLEQHEAAKADESRIRKALVEGRVVAGMTQQQVRQVWGEPSDVQLQIDQNASRERWVYRETHGGSRGTRSVSFKDGRVAGAQHNSQSRAHADQQKKQDR